MSWYYYSDAKEAKARVKREIAKRQKKGEPFQVLEAPKGNSKLAKTFWGKAWNDNLESYHDYEYRLPRGRSYLRQGNVYDLTLTAGEVSATVAGSELYDVTITLKPLPKDEWEAIKEKCAGQVASMLDLLAGKLGEGVLKIITDKESGLFPKSEEIRFSCSCPDHADMCKHVAATLYGVGVKLDTQPDLFFVLRSVDPTELLGSSALGVTTQTDVGLADEDLSALFGIELEPEPTPASLPSKKPTKKATRSKKDPKATATGSEDRTKRSTSSK